MRYEGPFDHLPAAREVEHRVIPWDDVTLEEGTGIVHIAPGCGTEDFELARVHDLPVLTPVDEAGRFYDDYGWLHGSSTVEATDQIIGDLGERGRLLEAGEIVHRYPVCWRCHTPLIFRIVDEWFISATRSARRCWRRTPTVKWTPDFYSEAHGRLAPQHGRLEHLAQALLRPAAPSLPLRVRPPERDRLAGRARGARRPAASTSSRSCTGPGSTRSRSAATSAGRRCGRIPEVGDAWLDAGIVPFSTLGWGNPKWKRPGRVRERAPRAGALGRRPTRPRLLGDVVPGRLGLGDARADPPLVLLAALHVGRARGPGAVRQVLAYEKLRDETGKEMHKSWGNAIEANEAMDQMGADVMRFMYCDHVPQQNLNFGYGPANEVKRRAPHLLELGVSFLVLYANIEGFKPTYRDPRRRPARGARAARPLAPRADAAARRGGDRRVRAFLDAGRSRRRGSASRTTSPTGTSAARASASTPSTRRRSGRSGTPSSRRCA